MESSRSDIVFFLAGLSFIWVFIFMWLYNRKNPSARKPLILSGLVSGIISLGLIASILGYISVPINNGAYALLCMTFNPGFLFVIFQKAPLINKK